MGRWTPFKCKEESLDTGFCIFHEPTYMDKAPYDEGKRQKLTERLNEIIDERIDSNESLLCIGYRLPGITIRKKFNKFAYFSRCEFLEKISFDDSNFQEGANFIGAIFHEDGSFFKGKFHGITDFSMATFIKMADFFYASFYDEAIFVDTKFGKAFFFGTSFKESANFSNANFFGIAFFTNSSFKSEAHFPDISFFSEVDFNNSEFYDKVYFSGNFVGPCNFHFVIFDGKQKVIFDVMNLSNTSFMNSDITQIRFSDSAIWGELGGDRFKVMEERSLEAALKYTLSWDKILKRWTRDRKKFKELVMANLILAGLKWEGKLKLKKNR